AGGKTIDKDVGADGGTGFSIPPVKTFGVSLASSITGVFAIHIEARDAVGASLASGKGMVAPAPGKPRDLTGGPGAGAPDDLGPTTPDLANSDNPDMALPIVVSEPIWIGSGGSAASATQKLNLKVSGFNTAGTVSAPSGAQFTAGYFTSQTY